MEFVAIRENENLKEIGECSFGQHKGESFGASIPRHNTRVR